MQHEKNRNLKYAFVWKNLLTYKDYSVAFYYFVGKVQQSNEMFLYWPNTKDEKKRIF